MIRLFALAVTLAMCQFPSEVYADNCLKIASDAKNIRAVRLFTPGIKEVFRKANICAEYINMPSRSMQKAMFDGDIDGEFIRVTTYLKAMKGYIAPVPTPIVRANGVIVSLKKTGFTPQSMFDVGNKKIGIVLGFKWHEVLAQSLKSTKIAKKYDTLAAMLKKQRIDGFLIEDISLKRLLEKGLLSQERINVSPAVIDLSAYLVMNRKHERLTDQLNQAMKTVKAEGGFKIVHQQEESSK